VHALIDFLQFNNMPLGELEKFVIGESVLMVGFSDAAYLERLRVAGGSLPVHFAVSSVEAGIVWQSKIWRVIVLDVETLGEATSIWLAGRVREDFPTVFLLGIRPKQESPTPAYRGSFRETIPAGSDPVLLMERIRGVFSR
jgi:hypothetical protein